MVQARNMKELAVGKEYLTFIPFDIALYEKAVQLVDARSPFKGTIMPIIGDLHVVILLKSK